MSGAVGCDVNLPNVEGDTPLWVACEKGNEEMVSTLLKQPGVAMDAGIAHIPLHASAAHGYTAIVQRLVDAGCDVNKVTTANKHNSVE